MARSRGISAAQFYWIVVGVTVAGFLLTIPYSLSEAHGPWKEVLLHLGTALIIAGLLAGTVDIWLKHRLQRDVFESVMGHTLPGDYQEAMREIYLKDAICEFHDQEVEIKRLAAHPHHVVMICQMERHIRNITESTIELGVGAGIDEWLDVAPSEVQRLSIQIEGQNRISWDPDELNLRTWEKGRPTVKAKGKQIRLGPGKVVKMWLQYQEVKPITSDHFDHFTYPTKNPQVRLKMDKDIEAVVAFPNETATNKEQYPENSYRYDGLVWSGQEIRVRWWDRSKTGAWSQRETKSIT